MNADVTCSAERASRSCQPRRSHRLATRYGLGLALLALPGCFGSVSEPARSYFLLNLQPHAKLLLPQVPGLLRVRDLDIDTALDRFHLLVRRSPYEVTYRQREVWAVKPNRMVSELLARGIAEQGLFMGVSRELSERRPDYLLGGALHSLEIEEAAGTWQVHLQLDLHLTQVETGRTLWTFTFDERQPVPAAHYPDAVAAYSYLMTQAITRALPSLSQIRSLPNLIISPPRPVSLSLPRAGSGQENEGPPGLE